MARIHLKNTRFWLFAALLVAAPLSKYPSIATPLFNFTSFRIGLYPVLSMLFVLSCLSGTLRTLPKLYQQSRTSMVSISILVFVSLLGLTTAIYKARSILLVFSVLLLLGLLMTAWWYVAQELEPAQYKKLIKLMLIAGCIYGIISVLQFIFAGFGHETFGLLCKSCNSQVFGFPRINGFAAEPQFHANALMIYFFVGIGVFYTSRSRLALSSAVLALIGIGLTFSRGAFLAVGIGTTLFFVLLRLQKQVRIKKIIKHAVGILIAIFVVAALLVAAASFRYRSTPDIAYKTFRSMVQQASLGIIKLPESNAIKSGFTPVGLVQASGQERLDAAHLALNAWGYNAHTLLIGVGPGNLGPFTVRHIDANAPENLTVYVYYVLVLSEFGVIGLLALLTLYSNALTVYLKRFWNHNKAAVSTGIFCLGIAFLIQYCFFGSYINVPYIWLWFGIILGLGRKAGKGAIL